MFEFCKLKISQKEFKIVESYLEELINSLRNDEVKNYTISKSLSEKKMSFTWLEKFSSVDSILKD